MADQFEPAKKAKLSAADMEAVIIGVLGKSAVPLTAYAIQNRAAIEGVRLYPTQVYRTMARLTAAGKTMRLESINSFLLTTEASDAVAICGECGRAIPVSARTAVEELKRLIVKADFEISMLVIEAHGRCRHCCAR